MQTASGRVSQGPLTLMLFNSIEYFGFLTAIVLAYFSMPYRWRNWLLLGGSYYFYMRWQWEYGFLMLGVTVANYVGGLLMASAKSPRMRKVWLAGTVTVSIAPLVFFKYFNFLNDSVRSLFLYAGRDYGFAGLNVILPVGISFFTLQALGYSIDIFRGKYPPERSFTRFALYVSFFPQLVAGPIERADHLLSQFGRQNHLDVGRLTEGGKLILWGLFKKVVIADNLATYVSRVYDSPDLYSGSTLLLATYFFAFQIYCDFSGYSDIAIGSARILGYDLMQNFRLPYLAASVRDFWRRWHISLSSWFADYVYIPLGGNRVSVGRWIFNIAAVFLLSGLWHGANWTFVVWGGLHACYYLGESFVDKVRKRQRMPILSPAAAHCLHVLITFHLVVLAWIFFRASNISDAFLIVRKIATDLASTVYRGPSQLETFVSLCLMVLLVLIQILQARGVLGLGCVASRLPRAVRWTGYMALVYGLLLLGKDANAFIYFQF